MTREEFNRLFAVTEASANYGSNEDQLWSAQDVERVNDDVFSRVSALDADDYHTQDAVKHAIDDAMTSMDTSLWFQASVKQMKSLPVRAR